MIIRYLHWPHIEFCYLLGLDLHYMISENTQMVRYFDIKRLDTNLSTCLSLLSEIKVDIIRTTASFEARSFRLRSTDTFHARAMSLCH